MTPSEISEWLESAGMFGGPKVTEGNVLKKAATTIRAQAEALKIATEALEDVNCKYIKKTYAHERTSQALSRIKGIG